MLYTISIIGHNDTNLRIKYSTEIKSSSFYSQLRHFKTKQVFEHFLPCGWRATFMEILDIYLDFNVYTPLRDSRGCSRSGRWDIAQQRLGFVYQNQSNRSNQLQKPRLDVYANAANMGLLQQQPVLRPWKREIHNKTWSGRLVMRIRLFASNTHTPKGGYVPTRPVLPVTSPHLNKQWFFSHRLLIRQTWAVKDGS